jgi:ABC-2 type transport system permease protein
VNGMRQGWLVAVREIRERSRSRAFLISLLVMIVAVVGVIVLPAMLTSDGGTRNIGLTGSVPVTLPAAIRTQSNSVGTTARIHHYASVAAGETAVHQGKIDVLVVGARRLEWPRQPDQQLRAVVTGAIQLVAVRERAAAAGISPRALAAVLTPVPVTNVQLGPVAGRGPGDQTAALVMMIVLLLAFSTYGGLVLTGVVEEKASRVVEVLLARIPARSLLAGKVTGIGLLGLAQITVTALAALIATMAVRSVNIPAIRGSVLAWVVVWFVLGYALYAMLYGALGSLASRTEDAQSVAGPATVLLVAAYFISFLAVGRPDSGLAKLASFFPATAPFAMPNRIAMGAAAWWEPVLAAAITLVTVAALVQVAGRLYTGAILRSGPTLKVRDAWRGRTPGPGTAKTGTGHTGTWLQKARATRAARPATSPTANTASLWTTGALIAVGAGLGAAAGVLARDAIIGVAVGAASYAVADRIVKTWAGHSGRPGSHS